MANAIKEKPGVCFLVASTWRGCQRRVTSVVGYIGLIFLLTNIPLGYGFAGLAAVMTAVTGNKNWAIIGTIGYGVTWAMLILSPFMMGKQNFVIVKKVIACKFKAWKRLRNRYK